MRVVVIANPLAGRGRTRALVERFAEAAGTDRVQWTQGPRHAVELAREAARAADVVCAVGGDGTVSEVVNGLMPDPIPMVVVPTGSGNDFASMVRCPRTPAALTRVLAAGRGVRLDVGDCGGRYCANSVGIGFEAMVTYHSRSIRRLRGVALYLLATFKALRSVESAPYRLDLDGTRVEGTFLLVSIGNGPRAGGGFRINPGAIPDDGWLDVCTADGMSRLRMLAILPRTLGGTHVRARGVATYRARRIIVSSPRAFPMHIDGEYVGRHEGPFTMTILPGRLPVLCEEGDDGRGTGASERVL